MKRQYIFLVIDTTRKDMAGCYDNSKMNTSDSDRLAKEGIRHENVYTCQPVCGLARNAIPIGTFPHTNGMVTNSIAMGDNIEMVGQRLSDNNIECSYIGKWHLDDSDYFGSGHCPEGWNPDCWYDMKTYLDELGDGDKVKSRDPEESYKIDFSEKLTYAYRCSECAIKYLETYKDKDFFLSASYDEPHGPPLCPVPLNHVYNGFKFDDCPSFQGNLSKKPSTQCLWAGKELHVAKDEINKSSDGLSLFLGYSPFMDYEIGRVFDKIKETALDTIVTFTFDHGDMPGTHRLSSKDAVVYKEVANIPLIIKEGASGCVEDAMVSHIDIAPTIMGYFGLPILKLLEGKSMLPQIYDTSKEINDVVHIKFTRCETDHDGFGGLQTMRAAISKRYKLVIHLLDNDESYDLEKDKYEMNNLINNENYAEARNAMHERLIEHMNNTKDLYRGHQWRMRPWGKSFVPDWDNEGYTRQGENEEYEPRQPGYDTGPPTESATRKEKLQGREMGDYGIEYNRT